MSRETLDERGAAPVPSGRAKVLVVDDDRYIRELVRLHLSNAGHEVASAEDALVAGRLIFRSTPDVMIVDVEMPYMSGPEFVAAARADAILPFIPVVFMSVSEQLAAQSRVFGAEHLVKPFYKEQLIEAVGRCVERRERERAWARALGESTAHLATVNAGA
jgi:CheY-like chemotaxis protein